MGGRAIEDTNGSSTGHSVPRVNYQDGLSAEIGSLVRFTELFLLVFFLFLGRAPDRFASHVRSLT
jgi:hypothetical protein